ncbi:MAG TPA: GNAT family N-acetyltransferase [Methanothrix sp.]|nr:GNAT family N-acetyltransferase [Methanothrix sp.]
MQVALRAACDQDEPFFFRLFCSIREPDFAFLGDRERDAILNMQYSARQRGLCANWPHARHMIVTEDGESIGRLSIARNGNVLHLIEIALLPERQNRGIGSFLMKQLVKEAGDCQGHQIKLYVFRSSRAVRFYQRMGFVPVSDDGVYLLMEKIVQENEA